MNKKTKSQVEHPSFMIFALMSWMFLGFMTYAFSPIFFIIFGFASAPAAFAIKKMKSSSGQSEILIAVLFLVFTSGLVLAQTINETANSSKPDLTGFLTGDNTTKIAEAEVSIMIWANTSILIQYKNHTIHSTLTMDNGSIVSNETISLYLNGSLIGEGLTDESGTSSYSLLALQPENSTHLITAEFLGNSAFFLNPSSADIEIILGLEENASEANETEDNETESDSSGLSVEIIAPDYADMGENISLIAVSKAQNTSNISLVILVPEGLELLEGNFSAFCLSATVCSLEILLGTANSSLGNKTICIDYHV